MAFTDDLTLLLSVEARDKASAIIDHVSDSLTSVSEHISGVSKSAEQMNAVVDKAFGDSATITERLSAETSRLETAELQAKLAAKELADANQAMADGSAGAFERQQLALDNLTGAQDRYAKAQARVADSTEKLKASQKAESDEAESASAKSDLLSHSFNAIGLGALGASVGIGLIAKSAVESAISYQQSTAQIANSANISTQSAQKIGDAFLSTAGQTTFSASDMASAYSQVAGQLGLTAGHALNAKQALGFMNIATETAEASGQSLGQTTSNLAKIMQAFNLNTKGAADAADIMYNASRVTGVGFGQFANQLTRMKSQLGALAPSIQDTATFMVDLTKHGITGRQAMMMMNTVMNQLTKTSAQATPTQREVAKAFQSLPPAMQPLAQAYENNSISATQFQKDIKGMSPAMQAYGAQFKSLVDKSQESAATLNALKLTPVQEALAQMGVKIFNTTGNFVGMGSVVGQLAPKIDKLHGTQAKLNALQPIFGNNSRKMLGVIEGGSKDWNKYNAVITDSTARHEAAMRASNTFEGSMQRLKSSVDDAKISIGNALLPVVMTLMHDVMGIVQPIISWVEHNKKLAATILEVAAGATIAVGTLYGIVKVSSAVSGTFESIGKAALKVIPGLAEIVAGNEAVTASEVEVGAASDVAAGGLTAVDVAGAPVIAIGLLIVAGLAAIAAGAYELYEHWNTVWSLVKSVTLSVWHFLDNNVIHPLADAFLWVYRNGILPFVTLLKGAFDIVTTIFQAEWDVIHFYIQTIWAIFMWLWHDGIEPAMQGIGIAFSAVWNNVVGPMVSWIDGNVIQPIGAFFSWLWHNAIEPAMSGIGTAITWVWHNIVLPVVSWIDTNITSPIVSMFEALPAAIGSAMSTLGSVLMGVFHTAFDAVAAVWNNSIGLIPGVPQMVWGSAPTNNTPSTWNPGTGGGATGNGSKIGIRAPSARASGGPVASGQPVWTGETGPELFIPSGAGRIISNSFGSSGSRGDGGGNVYVNVTMSGQVYGSLQDFANQLGAHLATNMLPAGGVVLQH